MSKKKNKKTEAPEVENPQVEEPQTEQPETEQEIEQQVENPEVTQPEPEPENNYPAYVKELLEKGVAVIQGRSRGEMDEKLAAIPSDVNFYTGHVDHYIGTGLYRVQVNLKEG